MESLVMASHDINKYLKEYNLEQFIFDKDLGKIEHIIKLKKQKPLPQEKRIDSFLIQSDKGVWILDVGENDKTEIITNLSESNDVKYHNKLTGDLIEVKGQSYRASPGDGGAVKQALAIGRIVYENRSSSDSLYTPKFNSAFVQKSDPVWKTWCQKTLKSEEHLLALLETSTSVNFEESILGKASADYHYVLTTHKNMLAAISEVGDLILLELPKKDLNIDSSLGRGTISCGDNKWTTTLTNEKLYKKIRKVAGMGPADSLRIMALIIWQEKGLKEIETVQQILNLLLGMDDAIPLDVLTRSALMQQVNDKSRLEDAAEYRDFQLTEPLRKIRNAERSSECLIMLIKQWDFPLSVGYNILHLFMESAETSEDALWAVPFHRFLHEEKTNTTKDSIELINEDIKLAEHLIVAEEYESARELVEPRLLQMPAGDLSDLLPGKDEDITELPDWPELRIRLLKLLNIAKSHGKGNHFESVLSLALCQPFSVSRMDALIESKKEQIAERVRSVQKLLSKQGLQSFADVTELPELNRVSPFSKEDLEILRHPFTREGNILGRLQGALAKKKAPNFNHMKQFCKKVTTEDEQLIIDIVGQGCLALGLPVVPSYLSHGEKSVGVRSFEGDPNFMLIGGNHVKIGSDFLLTPLELTFAIISELAHLRFKHCRVTSRAVMDGSFEKGMLVLDSIAFLLPFLKFIPLDKIVGKRKAYKLVRSVVPMNLLKKVYKIEDGRQLISKVHDDMGPLLQAGANGAQKVKVGIIKTKEQVDSVAHSREVEQKDYTADENISEDIGPSNDKLIVAHRVMQLTADRVGLVLCGDIIAAVKSMFLTSQAYQPELYLAQKNDLVTCLKRRDEKGNYILQDLAIRIGALISFFLTNDYQRLRQKITETRFGLD